VRRQDLLPANPLLFRYVVVLCVIYAGTAMGALLLLLHEQAGYCLYGAALMVYNAALPIVRLLSKHDECLFLSTGGIVSVRSETVQGLRQAQGCELLRS
jgi:hypothetical protein